MNEYICIYDDDEMQYIRNPFTDKDELIRCKDCKTNPYNKPACVDVVHGTPERCWDLASRKNAFCSEAEREEE